MNEEYFYENMCDFCEVDKILQESSKSIVDVIKTKAKEDINQYVMATVSQQLTEAMTRHNKEMEEARLNIRSLKAELDKKNNVTLPKYSIGDEVYVLSPAPPQYFLCPKCNGKGTFVVADKRTDAEFNVVCPSCNNSDYGKNAKKAEAAIFKPKKVKIRRVLVYLDEKGTERIKIGGELDGYVDGTPSFWRYHASTEEECTKYCLEVNAHNIAEAKAKVGIETTGWTK